jgi:hypothetical protein
VPGNKPVTKIIALTGYMGSGKSTAAAHLRDAHGYEVVPFAAPLKNMLRALGVPEESLTGADKEVPLDLLGGRTARHAMQTLGTEWGRNLISPDLWISVWRKAIEGHEKVAVDDMRFLNEAQAVRDLGGLIVRIKHPRDTDISLHDSERFVPLLIPDTVLRNTGSLDDFNYTVSRLSTEFDQLSRNEMYVRTLKAEIAKAIP